MYLNLLITVTLLVNVECINTKYTSSSISETKVEDSKGKSSTHFPTKAKGAKWTANKKNKPKVPSAPKPTASDDYKYVSNELINEWATDISNTLLETERCVVRRPALIKSFSDVKFAVRNGTAIVEQTAKVLEDLLQDRARAAEKIMRKTEALARKKLRPTPGYQFLDSVALDELKPLSVPAEDEYELPLDCRSPYKARLQNSSHFNAFVNLDMTSVHMSAEVFYCDSRVLPDVFWSEDLLSTFRENYAQDAMLDFQYFCSAKGFLRHYPAASWESLFNLHLDIPDSDVYDCRLRPWYVSASGAPRDVLLLLDASGSMSNSSKEVIAEKFVLAMLSALTDDDQVNVLRFNVEIESPIDCFNDRLVPANHENTAAIMAAMEDYKSKVKNESKIAMTLEEAVALLKKQRELPDRPTSCQQVIILITDSLYENFTEHMQKLDPSGDIRLFVLWLHDPFGLRDSTREFGESMSCARDGHFAELLTHADVTEQVMRILRVLERPLVQQRHSRLSVFSDVYAHVEDPRRSDYYWTQKENHEQAYRYQQLRINKDRLLNGTVPMENYLRFKGISEYGQYYEGETVNYRLQISVSVPVFDYITSENITIKLMEENQRNATRTYPVNRLLGVAGIDIPVDHLKLYLPYHKLGAGGIFMLLDHRGNVVIHENIKPVFDGDILKPGYRTVDFLDIEQPAEEHSPRNPPKEWLELRKAMIIDKESGSQTLKAKQIFEDGMRTILEDRTYYWKRILDHYTMVAVLPTYNRNYPVATGSFSQDLAEQALAALSRTDFAINPDWLYCRHVDPHFDDRNHELLYFIRRRRDDPNFPMKFLKHSFSPIPPTVVEKTYMCDEELMVRLSRDAVATQTWAEEHEEADTERDCSRGEMGPTTAFLATESGLTRWQQYHTTCALCPPPDASAWSGAGEPWFRRAVAAPHQLVVHAPIAPLKMLRNTDAATPPVGIRAQWFTAARTLGHPSLPGFLGVAGYHFYPEHLYNVLKSITYDMMESRCSEEDENLCEPRCDGVTWTCLLIDDAGWIVTRTRDEGEGDPPDPSKEAPREHLATYYPKAMAALLNAKVFSYHWVHDYQAICFPEKSAASFLPSLLRSLWRSVNLLWTVTSDFIAMVSLLNFTPVEAETEKEKRTRRRKLFRDFAREKFDGLYDDRVLVNRTTFAACDRTRPVYELQRDEAAVAAALSQDVRACAWPMRAALVPGTNLLLAAALRACNRPTSRAPPPPAHNLQVDMSGKMGRQEPNKAAELACWRNMEVLPDRVIRTQCFPHQYKQEEGYRQCGPWLPNPEPDGE